MTQDIDVLEVPTKLKNVLEKYDMNTRVTAYLDSFPYNYEDRLIGVSIGDTVLDYYTPSLEDLVVSKLYSMRQPDVEDITSIQVLETLDWGLLERLVYDKDEAAASALSERRYKEMASAYEDYKKEYRPCVN